MNSKKNILVLIDWYVPGYKAGGQIRSCSNLVMQLKKYFNFMVLTRDTDLSADKPYENIISNKWTLVHDDVPIYYLSPNNLSYSNLKKLILSKDFNIIYLNSFFSFYFTLLPILIVKGLKQNKKIVLATSGMLSEQALKIKPLKKKIFLALAKLFGIYKNITLVASSEIEKADVIKTMGSKATVIIGPNLAKPVNMEKAERQKNPNELKLVYLSRIHPIKNLHKTLNYLLKIDKIYKVEFDIYGPVENKNYWARCQQLISALPSNITCNYKDEIHNDLIAEVYKKYHFSILPSESENFGYSIIESFVSSCPVIISDNTPWQELQAKFAGFDLPLNKPEQFVEALEKICKMDQHEYNKWSDGAYAFAKSVIDNQEKIEQNIKTFEI